VASIFYLKERERCCRVQYSTVQYSTVQYSTVQYSTVQYSTVQYSTVLQEQRTGVHVRQNSQDDHAVLVPPKSAFSCFDRWSRRMGVFRPEFISDVDVQYNNVFWRGEQTDN
jgi:hypothetical protein